jgi:hypothetical protein
VPDHRQPAVTLDANPLNTIADVGVLGQHLDRIDREVDSDPAGAISAAKALIDCTEAPWRKM